MNRFALIAASALAAAALPLSASAAMKCTGNACTALSVEDHFAKAGAITVDSATFMNRGKEVIVIGYNTVLGKGCTGQEQMQIPMAQKTAIQTPMCGDTFKAYYYSSIYGAKR